MDKPTRPPTSTVTVLQFWGRAFGLARVAAWDDVAAQSARAVIAGLVIATLSNYWAWRDEGARAEDFDKMIRGGLLTLIAWVLVYLGALAIRLIQAPAVIEAQHLVSLGALTAAVQEPLRPFYGEKDVACRDDWTNPDNDDPIRHAWFRIGIINDGPRISSVRATCGETDPALTPGLHGVTLYSYPDEVRMFDIPASAAGKPSIYVTVAKCDVIWKVGKDGNRTADVWTRYTIGPARDETGYLAYGTIVDSVPQLRVIVRIECPSGTLAVPCLISLDGQALKFALVASPSLPRPRFLVES